MAEYGSPMLPSFYKLALSAYEEKFLPYVQQTSEELDSSLDPIREFLEDGFEIKEYQGDGDSQLVFGVDSASRTIQFGEISVAIGAGYNVPSVECEGVSPECYFNLKVGTNADGFSIVAGQLRFCADVTLLAMKRDGFTLYDGSFQS